MTASSPAAKTTNRNSKPCDCGPIKLAAASVGCIAERVIETAAALVTVWQGFMACVRSKADTAAIMHRSRLHQAWFQPCGFSLISPPIASSIRCCCILEVLHLDLFATGKISSERHLQAAVPDAYETISYVWGDPSRTDRLRVDGRSVAVPASAVAALRRVRLDDMRRVVWLDAVCINQSDERERVQQVSMMGDVYRLGVGNLIYLGEADITSALDSIDTILDEAETEPDSFKRMRNDAGAWQYASTGIIVRFDAEALVKLFSLSWFR
nr:heterokaryon incompatibility protein 6, or allele [Quercus suber]